MADLFENPIGLDGFEFVEFASPTPGVLEPVFELLGFTAVARHRSKAVTLYRQGDINFILNEEPKSHAAYFASEHDTTLSASSCWLGVVSRCSSSSRRRSVLDILIAQIFHFLHSFTTFVAILTHKRRQMDKLTRIFTHNAENLYTLEEH